MFSAVGPDRRTLRTWWSSLATIASLRSRKCTPSHGCTNARRNSWCSDGRVIGRPPSPATTECTCGAPAVLRRARSTLLASCPPMPMAKLFSITTTCLAPTSASRSACVGNGRNDTRVTRPLRKPSARISIQVRLRFLQGLRGCGAIMMVPEAIFLAGRLGAQDCSDTRRLRWEERHVSAYFDPNRWFGACPQGGAAWVIACQGSRGKSHGIDGGGIVRCLHSSCFEGL